MIQKVTDAEIKRQKDVSAKIKELNNGKKLTACVVTLGCVQNENDSERIRGMLSDMGYEMCNNSKTADVVIFNTCAVR